MDEGSVRVRRIQAHLRSAAERLGAHRLEEALQEVNAALSIDSGSLAAQTLRTRIEAALAASPSPPAAQHDTIGGTAVPHTGVAERYVPPGVEANIWIGFEKRIQDRRFRALLETIRTALDRGDGIGARIALEEARELRSGAPELDEIGEQVARLPMASAVEPGRRSVSTRVAGAVLLLLAGMSLLIGFERLHEPQPSERMLTPLQHLPIAEPEEAGQPLPAPVATATPSRPAASPTREPVGTSGSGQTADAAPARPIATPPPDPAAPEPRRPSAAPQGSAVSRQPFPDNQRSFPVASNVARSPTQQPSASLGPSPSVSVSEPPIVPGAPQSSAPASSSPPAASSASSPTREPAAADEPLDVTDAVRPVVSAPPPPAVELSEAPASAINVSRDARDLVEQVLNQYARRYTQLDAAGLRGVWPSAPERDLARAFSQLESQMVAFDDCTIDVQGSAASASCRGSQRFVTRVGSREPRTEARLWDFVLRRDGDEWKIEEARVSPQ